MPNSINILDCDANQLLSLNTNSLPNLTRLECSFNYISTLDLSNNIALDRLESNDKLNAKWYSCHSGNSGEEAATITSDIPVNGYVLGNTYTISITGVKANCIKFGFELTAENGNYKSGDFMITDNTTKLVNK